jgi:hypothetical protein
MSKIAVLAVAVLASLASGQSQKPPLIRIQISTDTSISGVRCAPTGRAKAELFTSGQLASCPLASDTVISGHRLAAGTWIDLTEDGALRAVWLNHDTVIGELLCKGTGYKGWSTGFHPSGALRVCFLVNDAILDGIPCRGGSFLAELRGTTQVILHENGRLRSCSVARDIERDGVRFGKRDRIELDSSGRLVTRHGGALRPTP